MKSWLVLSFIWALLVSSSLEAQDLSGLDLEGDELKILLEEIPLDTEEKEKKINRPDSIVKDDFSELEKIDGFSQTDQKNTSVSDEKFLNEFESFKRDMGDLSFGELVIEEPDTINLQKEGQKKKQRTQKKTRIKKAKAGKNKVYVFDAGKEERELLEISKYVKGKISKKDWESILTKTNRQTYVVQKNDWLFKIARKLFGSGFYYPKIWSINSYITNPHEIEPGMVLVFDMGSMSSLPGVKVGAFEKGEKKSINMSAQALPKGFTSFESFGESAKPPWLDEKAKLLSKGTFFQYATDATMEDLKRLSSQSLVEEYKNYSPPRLDYDIELPSVYDKTGFDRSSKLEVNYKQGFFLNTFIANNPVKDFGFIDHAIKEGILLGKADTVYLKLDDINPMPGDDFSIYRYDGEVSHKKSERRGDKYTIIGQVKIIGPLKNGLWQAKIGEGIETIERGDRITSYTPKIEKITQRFSSRKIEAIVMASYNQDQTLPNFGDVVFLDRGRADGVELGDIFEVWGFKDRLTKDMISYDPTYKNGEVTIISVTDNFATALITSLKRDFKVGDIAITKSKMKALMASRINGAKQAQAMANLDSKNNLDVELNLEDLNEDMLKGAERIEFTEEELAELEKLEKEKSIIETAADELSDLEKLEKQLELAEKELSEGKRDEDHLLENSSLDDLEQKQRFAFEDDLEIIEENFGKKYLDQELNKNQNPYGLTEFDIEEVDELLNLDKNPDYVETNKL